MQEFCQQGKVLLVGDLNCRLGDRQADGGLGETFFFFFFFVELVEPEADE